MGLKLRTTTAGWLPKPRALLLARWRHAEGEIDDRALGEATVRAVRAAVERQTELGLDLLVDGQLDRSDVATHFGERLGGIEVGGLVRCFDNRYYRVPRIVGPIERTAPLCVEAWSRARQLTGRPLKALVTGPYTLMDWSSDEHYPSREACCLAFAEAIRGEVEDLVAAGVTEIQLDEPAISVRPGELELVAAALERAISPARERARVWVHVCYGDLAPLLEQILALPADGLMLGLVGASEALIEGLAGLPADKSLAAGVVEAASDTVESAAELETRIAAVLEHVPADRLWIAPDAGLRATGESVAWEKLAVLVAAARGPA